MESSSEPPGPDTSGPPPLPLVEDCLQRWRGPGNGLVAAGGHHSLMIGPDGRTYAFGDNHEGQLGVGDQIDRDRPTPVEGIDQRVVCVAAGGNQSAVIDESGQLFICGTNILPGSDDSDNYSHSNTFKLLLTDVIGIACGPYHAVAVLNNGVAMAYGHNGDPIGYGIYCGQLGIGQETSQLHNPTPIIGLPPIAAVACGYNHTLFLLADGRVAGCGSNANYQIGVPLDRQRGVGDVLGPIHHTPIILDDLTEIVSIGAGDFYSMAVRSDGQVFTWGDGTHGRLGHGDKADQPRPEPIIGVTDAIGCSVYGFSSAILHQDGGVSIFGDSWDQNPNRMRPNRISNLENVIAITCGWRHFLAMHADGTVSHWNTGPGDPDTITTFC